MTVAYDREEEFRDYGPGESKVERPCRWTWGEEEGVGLFENEGIKTFF